jgi:DNA-directed RNA polymerase sigma subunit (sigma70/sigma32)
MDENEVVKSHLGLVYNIAKSFHPVNQTELDEYIQEGNIALLKALRKYDVTRGKISTFAWQYIHKAIKRYIQKRKQIKEVQIPFVLPPCESSIELWEILPSNLSERELQIIQMRWQGYTFENIGKKFGLTKSWACQEFNKIIDRIKIANE